MRRMVVDTAISLRGETATDREREKRNGARTPGGYQATQWFHVTCDLDNCIQYKLAKVISRLSRDAIRITGTNRLFRCLRVERIA